MWEGLGFESPGAGGGGGVVGWGLGRWSAGPVFTPKPEPLGGVWESGVGVGGGGGVERRFFWPLTVP